MDIFNIVAGISSIISLLISVFIANKIIKINNKINIGDSQKVKQNMSKNNIIGGTVKQQGINYGEDNK